MKSFTARRHFTLGLMAVRRMVTLLTSIDLYLGQPTKYFDKNIWHKTIISEFNNTNGDFLRFFKHTFHALPPYQVYTRSYGEWPSGHLFCVGTVHEGVWIFFKDLLKKAKRNLILRSQTSTETMVSKARRCIEQIRSEKQGHGQVNLHWENRRWNN